MNEKITTAEELDALPVGSVVRDRDRDEWTKRATPPVWVTPETRPFAFGSEDVARIWAPLTLVSRPDAPTAVVVKRFGDYDLALHVDGSVTWRDTGRVPVLPAAPAAEDRECRDCGRSDGGCDRDVEGAPVVSAEAAEDYAAGRWCGECRHGVVEDPPCCTPCPCCGGHSGEHQPAPVVSAEQVEAAWESAAYLVVDDPNGPEFGVVHLPFSQKDRMLRTLAALGIEAPRG